MKKIYYQAALGVLLAGPAVQAQMHSANQMPGFDETMGITPDQPAAFVVSYQGCDSPGNVLWPGDQPAFRFKLINTTKQALTGHGKVELIPYQTRIAPDDIWVPHMSRLGAPTATALEFDVAPGKTQDLEVRCAVPEKFGAYALAVDLGPAGQRFLTSCVRTFKPAGESPRLPQIATDVTNPDVLHRLGACPNRCELHYNLPTTDPGFAAEFSNVCKRLDPFALAPKLPVIIEIGVGQPKGIFQPMRRNRPHLLDNDFMTDDWRGDWAWLPAYDKDFQTFVKLILAKYGWPNGPIVAVKFQNEPWEGGSIAAWGADMLRYREIYTAMAEAVVAARKEYGVDVLVGGCDSSSNASDKLFGDGKDDLLHLFDFCSVHYQGLNIPSTYQPWRERKGGRVLLWDTESWVANSEDRVAAVIATFLSCGLDRAVGIYHGNISSPSRGGAKSAVDTWSVAAALGATEWFIGQRPFERLLFPNGLPWVLVFGGVTGPEDGTVVVVGDIGGSFGHDGLPFRTVHGCRELARKAKLEAELAALPETPPATLVGKEKDAYLQHRKELQHDIHHEVLTDASLTLDAAGNRCLLYDFYGNPVPAQHGKIVVPLDGRGFFLRGDGKAGSFAALLAALQQARIAGLEPLAKQVLDMTSPVDQPNCKFRLKLTNVLNRPIKGTLAVAVRGLRVTDGTQPLAFAANETKILSFAVTGTPTVDNAYALTMRYDAGTDGIATHAETLHVNQIAKRTITVDGNLDDWQGVVPQTLRAEGPVGPTLTEAAWQPHQLFPQGTAKGFATGYLAYDDHYFYFAAKIADETPDGGTLRFATRDDDAFFYPEISYSRAKDGTVTTNTWPEGVRRYSYRKSPILPWNGDSIQIGFNVIDSKPGWLPYPAGTMPGYVGYPDTDYEFCLNKVADKFGGGTEIWRDNVPGMPHKHFYPRQGKSPFDGPVTDGKLVVIQGDTTRIVECAIPWTEMPEVKRRIDAGQTVKFSFRVNDDKSGPCMELARDRSISRNNQFFTFRPDWAEHWANELEFAAQP